MEEQTWAVVVLKDSRGYRAKPFVISNSLAAGKAVGLVKTKASRVLNHMRTRFPDCLYAIVDSKDVAEFHVPEIYGSWEIKEEFK